MQGGSILFYSGASTRLSETKQNKMNAKRSSYCTFALTVTFSGPFCFGAVLAGGVLTVDPLRLVDQNQLLQRCTLRKIGVGFPTFRGIAYVQPLGYD